MKGTLKCGFSYEIEDDALDNWDLIEKLREIDKGDTSAIVDAFPLLLGEEQFAALKKHLRGDGKRVRFTDMVGALVEIREQQNSVKK